MQAALRDQLVRLGSEHPYHTLYHLYALNNGNLGRDGQPTASGTNVGGMLQLIDHSKIAAASAVLQQIQATSTRYSCPFCITTSRIWNQLKVTSCCITLAKQTLDLVFDIHVMHGLPPNHHMLKTLAEA